jgi:hypothetical protein
LDILFPAHKSRPARGKKKRDSPSKKKKKPLKIMKPIIENLVVDLEQISEHLFGINQITHFTRVCPICQPGGPRLRCPKQTLSLLPASFPSDIDFEMAKLGLSDNISKRLLILDDKKTPYAKELILFFSTLNYQIQDHAVPTTKLVIICMSSKNLKTNIDQIIQEHTVVAQKTTLIILDSFFQSISKQPNIFYIIVKDVQSLRKLHLMLLQQIGRSTVQQVVDFCKLNDIKTVCENNDMLKESFIY